MMKCVILDDEPFAHQVLEHYINQIPSLQLVAGFRNSVEAYEFLNNHKVDLLFLDIEMPLINGINFLRALAHKPFTIFTTAYKEYAFEGFELGVVDYLLKPFSYERFVKAIDKISQSADISVPVADTLVIKEKDGLLNIKQQDINYIEGCKDYIKIITAERHFVIYHTLKGIVQKLNAGIFLQTHRSYIVNKAQIARITQEKLILLDETEIPIGLSYRKAFLKGINKA
jgi:two-component system response regulator LytT